MYIFEGIFFGRNGEIWFQSNNLRSRSSAVGVVGFYVLDGFGVLCNISPSTKPVCAAVAWMQFLILHPFRFTYVFIRTPYWASSTARARLMALMAPYKVTGIEHVTLTPLLLALSSWCHGSLTRYVKLRVAHAPGMPGTFYPPPTSNEAAS